jgi:hypothetical protein
LLIVRALLNEHYVQRPSCSVGGDVGRGVIGADRARDIPNSH